METIKYVYPATRAARLAGMSRALEQIARAHESAAADMRPGRELARQLHLAKSARRLSATTKQDAFIAAVLV